MKNRYLVFPVRAIRRLVVASALAGLVAGCGADGASSDETDTLAQPLAPLPVDPIAHDAGHAAWVEQVVPVLLGRPVRSHGEHEFLTVLADREGRGAVADAIMQDPAFVDRWTGVLLDRMRVDREGSRSQQSCFQTPRLTNDTDQRTAARLVLATRRAGADPALTEPAGPTTSAPFNMADVVRGSLLLDNLFPAYRGFLFALVKQRSGVDETEPQKTRQIADHFTEVFTNKSIVCMQCHRTFNGCSEQYFTPAYSAWSEGHEGKVFSGLPQWGRAGMSAADFAPASDAAWTGSFASSSGTTAPFAGWSTTDCGGGFAPDTSAAAASDTGLFLGPSSSANVWTLDDRLKEGYLALKAAYATSGALDAGTGTTSQGRTIAAYWMAAAVANDVWKEVFGISLTIPNFVSRNTDEQRLLWHLTEQQVIGRNWSLKGLLHHIVTSSYFNRGPTSAQTMPKIFQPFIDSASDPQDYVGDVVHRRTTDHLFRRKAWALGWKNGSSLLVTHFPGSGVYPTRSDADGMGLHLSRFHPASHAISQLAMLAWEGSAGRCEKPSGVGTDWIDALATTATAAGTSVGGTIEALRWRLLGGGISRDVSERVALSAFTGVTNLGVPFSTAFGGGSGGVAALRALCGALVKTPHFMMEGIPLAIGSASSDFDGLPELVVGDVKPDGTLASDKPSEACETWRSAFTGASIPLDCSNVQFPPVFDWRAICPRARCLYIDVLRFRPPNWPCLSCPFAPDWFSSRPPPVDIRKTYTEIGNEPSRAGTFLVWAENATITKASGDIRIVRQNEKVEEVEVGKTLALGDSLELGGGASFEIKAVDGEVFASPKGGMPKAADGNKWVFMATGEKAIPEAPKYTPHLTDRKTTEKVVEAMRLAEKNEEPDSVSFFHEVVSPAGSSSYLSHPALDGKEDRIVLVMNVVGKKTNTKSVGVRWDKQKSQWAIFNEGGAEMPAGAMFSVRVMSASKRVFVHAASSKNLAGHSTYLDHPALDGLPSAAVQVSQVWNPPGSKGVTNDHPIGVWYDTQKGKWAVYNEDYAAMPSGASFAVKVGGYQSVVASKSNRVGNAIVIDAASTNGVPDARLFLTHNRNPSGDGGSYHTKQSALRYDTTIQKWTIVNVDGSTVADKTAFNVHRAY